MKAVLVCITDNCIYLQHLNINTDMTDICIIYLYIYKYFFFFQIPIVNFFKVNKNSWTSVPSDLRANSMSDIEIIRQSNYLAQLTLHYLYKVVMLYRQTYTISAFVQWYFYGAICSNLWCERIVCYDLCDLLNTKTK